MLTASPPASRLISSFPRWWPTACSMASMKARRWWRPPGTHLLAREEGAAAIGNVYTRRDHGGGGLGRLVTSAVVGELSGVETIGLNVRADNAAALHLYESLGFARHAGSTRRWAALISSPSSPALEASRLLRATATRCQRRTRRASRLVLVRAEESKVDQVQGGRGVLLFREQALV